MPTTDTPPPQAVDYSGRPLTEGDNVAFLSHDPLGLTAGRIRVISPQSICIETGPHLVTFTGAPASLGMPRPRPIDGTVERDEDVQEPFRYSQIALQPSSNGGKVNVFVGSQDIVAAVRADVAREMNRITRIQRGDV